MLSTPDLYPRIVANYTNGSPVSLARRIGVVGASAPPRCLNVQRRHWRCIAHWVSPKELFQPSDWRITCFFVDKDYRGKGVTSIALAGVLNEIARFGGGVVESYPEDVEGRSTSGSFVYNGTVSIFEWHGFQRTRKLGKNHWVVSKVVECKSG